jgi:hypothetical protein
MALADIFWRASRTIGSGVVVMMLLVDVLFPTYELQHQN